MRPVLPPDPPMPRQQGKQTTWTVDNAPSMLGVQGLLKMEYLHGLSAEVDLCRYVCMYALC